MRPFLAPLVALALTVSGCGQSALDVASPSPTGASADACQALYRALPESVRGFSQRNIKDDTAYVAAWGEDAVIVLKCGVSRPEGLTATAQVVEVNGVDWFPETFERGTVFTTFGRVAYVEVQVPLELRPEANVLTDLASAITQAVPLGDVEN